MARLLNAQKSIAEEVGKNRAMTRQAVVTSYDPQTYSIQATLQPDGVSTGWMPLKSVWIGNGWGMFCPPSIGDTIEVSYQEDNGNIGSGGWRFYDANNRPLPCPSGEFWLVHKSGAVFKLLNAGGGVFSDGNGATLSLDGAGNANLQAKTLTISAMNINSSGTWDHEGGITNNGVNIGSTHVHSGVVRGGSNTFGPQ